MNLARLVCLMLLGILTRPERSQAGDPDWSGPKKNHWAWKAPVRPALPAVRNEAWVRNPIDAFVLAKLEAAKLKPAEPASRGQLIRRATFDLIGLPPAPEEIDAFVNDRAPKAWEKVVERLLASPHYGERWGRHWLALAPYPQTTRSQPTKTRPNPLLYP